MQMIRQYATQSSNTYSAWCLPVPYQKLWEWIPPSRNLLFKRGEAICTHLLFRKGRKYKNRKFGELNIAPAWRDKKRSVTVAANPDCTLESLGEALKNTCLDFPPRDSDSSGLGRAQSALNFKSSLSDFNVQPGMRTAVINKNQVALNMLFV